LIEINEARRENMFLEPAAVALSPQLR